MSFKGKFFCIISSLLFLTAIQSPAKEACDKMYINPSQIVVDSIGFFVEANGLCLSVSAIHHDDNGYFVNSTECEPWTCPQCGTRNNKGPICSVCSWPVVTWPGAIGGEG